MNYVSKEKLMYIGEKHIPSKKNPGTMYLKAQVLDVSGNVSEFDVKDPSILSGLKISDNVEIFVDIEQSKFCRFTLISINVVQVK